MALYFLVVFSTDKPTIPIGFSRFSISVADNGERGLDDDYSSCSVVAEYLLDYVSPEYRGMGYGFALSSKRGTLFEKQLDYLLGQLKGTDVALRPVAFTDLESEAGERLAYISNELVSEYIECLEGTSKQVNIKSLEIDEGF